MTMTDNSPQAFTGPHWTEDILDELQQAGMNGRVGSRIVSETESAQVCLIKMQPDERLPFHTHVLDYFWTATTPGKARSRYSDGQVVEADYAKGDTKHHFTAGEQMTHDLENIGDTILCFTTVGFLDSANCLLF